MVPYVQYIVSMAIVQAAQELTQRQLQVLAPACCDHVQQRATCLHPWATSFCSCFCHAATADKHAFDSKCLG